MAGPDYSGIQQSINTQYGTLRQQAAQQESANLQGQKDALARRAAQLGGGPGGAFIKAEQQAGNTSAQRLQQANAGIDQQQASDNRNLQMTQLGQQYQTSEREAGQQFQTGMQQSQFGQQEKLQGEQFGQQNKMQGAEFGQQKNLQNSQQNFTAAESQKAYKQQTALQNSQQNFTAAESEKGRQLQESEFEKNLGFENVKFQEQTSVDQFNEKIAQQMADKKDILEQLFSNFSVGNLWGPGSNVGNTLGGGGGGVIGGIANSVTSAFGGGGGGGSWF